MNVVSSDSLSIKTIVELYLRVWIRSMCFQRYLNFDCAALEDKIIPVRFQMIIPHVLFSAYTLVSAIVLS